MKNFASETRTLGEFTRRVELLREMHGAQRISL